MDKICNGYRKCCYYLLSLNETLLSDIKKRIDDPNNPNKDSDDQLIGSLILHKQKIHNSMRKLSQYRLELENNALEEKNIDLPQVDSPQLDEISINIPPTEEPPVNLGEKQNKIVITKQKGGSFSNTDEELDFLIGNINNNSESSNDSDDMSQDEQERPMVKKTIQKKIEPKKKNNKKKIMESDDESDDEPIKKKKNVKNSKVVKKPVKTETKKERVNRKLNKMKTGQLKELADQLGIKPENGKKTLSRDYIISKITNNTRALEPALKFMRDNL
ncbi:MAG TPA: hypothetical protein PKG56_00025 [Chitinophagaceae bacterium]|nr:hypothetical protein [Chitinophagaceae bacterium]HNL81752.1 hypothetical protein [Chitinophagaceae bacterium]